MRSSPSGERRRRAYSIPGYLLFDGFCLAEAEQQQKKEFSRRASGVYIVGEIKQIQCAGGEECRMREAAFIYIYLRTEEIISICLNTFLFVCVLFGFSWLIVAAQPLCAMCDA